MFKITGSSLSQVHLLFPQRRRRAWKTTLGRIQQWSLVTLCQAEDGTLGVYSLQIYRWEPRYFFYYKKTEGLFLPHVCLLYMITTTTSIRIITNRGRTGRWLIYGSEGERQQCGYCGRGLCVNCVACPLKVKHALKVTFTRFKGWKERQRMRHESEFQQRVRISNSIQQWQCPSHSLWQSRHQLNN